VCVFKVNPDAGDVGVTPFYCQALPVSLANPRQTGFAGLANPDLDPRTDRTVSLNPTRIQIWIQQIEYSIRIHGETVTPFRSISMPAGFRRHLLDKI